MQSAHQIIKKPVLTEKTINCRGQNKYVFFVEPRANKNQIKAAFKHIFKVDPIKINTTKQKTLSRFSWRTKSTVKTGNYKKATITLLSKDKIDLLSIKK